MDVTPSQLQESTPEIEEAINSASSALMESSQDWMPTEGNTSIDLQNRDIDKLQESARQFLLVQFGLYFHYNPENGSYTNQTYNFLCLGQDLPPGMLQIPGLLPIKPWFPISQTFDSNKLFRDMEYHISGQLK